MPVVPLFRLITVIAEVLAPPSLSEMDLALYSMLAYTLELPNDIVLLVSAGVFRSASSFPRASSLSYDVNLATWAQDPLDVIYLVILPVGFNVMYVLLREDFELMATAVPRLNKASIPGLAMVHWELSTAVEVATLAEGPYTAVPTHFNIIVVMVNRLKTGAIILCTTPVR